MDSLRQVMLNFRHKTANGGLSSEENVCKSLPNTATITNATTDEEQLRTSTETPSPSTSYNSEASTSTTSRNFRSNLGPLPSEPMGHPPIRTGSGGGLAKRKAAMLSRMFKTGSVDLFITSSTSTVGSANTFVEETPKRKKSGGSAKKLMRRKMSAAKSAIRKFSHAGKSNPSTSDGLKHDLSSAEEKSPPIYKYEEGGKTRFLPAAFRSPGGMLRKSSEAMPKKKPLGPSLSWDPEHR